MNNYRTWGKTPFRVVVVHGGPGTPGAVAPVARELSKNTGVLEPLETKDSIDGQVEELADVLKKHSNVPVVLVGHSWGSTLSYLTAARHPDLVKKLILIGTVPLEWKEMPDFMPAWLARLSEEERTEYLSLAQLTWDGAAEDKSGPMRRFIRLVMKAESYELIPMKDEVLQYQPDINMAISLEMRRLLKNGGLFKASRLINCPVVVIQGANDPRTAADMRESLSCAHKDFKFFLLEKCGHMPWYEKYARDKFFEVLKKEID